MNNLPQSEIKAIAKLLKSGDEATTLLVQEQLQSFDNSVLKEIDNEIPLEDKVLKDQFLDLIYSIKRERLKKEFTRWSSNTTNDLEEGIVLVANFYDPFFERETLSEILNSWASAIKENLKGIKLDEATSIINEINHFLFMDLGFKGNVDNYYAQENSFINKVIETKTGNPILLSTIYLLLAKRLELPIEGVNMPAHFLVKYIEGIEPIYIDPFNQGEIVTKAVCKDRIKTLKLPWNESFLLSPTNKQIISRVIQNLINTYQNDNDFDSKDYFEEYLKSLSQ